MAAHLAFGKPPEIKSCWEGPLHTLWCPSPSHHPTAALPSRCPSSLSSHLPSPAGARGQLFAQELQTNSLTGASPDVWGLHSRSTEHTAPWMCQKGIRCFSDVQLPAGNGGEDNWWMSSSKWPGKNEGSSTGCHTPSITALPSLLLEAKTLRS